jgi:hypothetical protein
MPRAEERKFDNFPESLPNSFTAVNLGFRASDFAPKEREHLPGPGSARICASGSRVTSRRVGILPDHPERVHPHHVAALPKVPGSRILRVVQIKVYLLHRLVLDNHPLQ